MKLLSELLGFAVLTGPLWLIVLLLALGVWIAVNVAKRIRSTVAKAVIGSSVVALVLILPFADEIVGRVYFRYLCSTKAEVKVFQTVELPAKYWDENGRATFYTNWDSDLGKSYPLTYKRGAYSSFLNIDNAGHHFVDKHSGKMLGEVVDFTFKGGWISKNMTAHNSVIGCLDYTKPSNRLVDRIFRPAQK